MILGNKGTRQFKVLGMIEFSISERSFNGLNNNFRNEYKS